MASQVQMQVNQVAMDNQLDITQQLLIALSNKQD
jgi:hypothetical protein